MISVIKNTIKGTLLLLMMANSSIVVAQQMWINELHYDNQSNDENEFIEVVLHNIYAGELSDIQVVYYNGSTGEVYDDTNIKSLDTFVIGDTQGSFTVYSKLTPGIQNGNPDGMALVKNGRVIQFISYEGSFTANNGPAIGLTSIDIGELEDPSSDPNSSLQLMGSGSQASDFSWHFPSNSTMGLVNTNQTLETAIPLVEIFEVQGSAEVSPYEMQVVTLQDNTITAINTNGFFMQTPNIRDDNDSDTSNGLYVLNEAKIPVTIGDNVSVTGTVHELFSLTELNKVTDVSINSQGNTLPDTVVFNENRPSPDPLNPSCAIEYECYEGMLIEIANGMTNSGSELILQSFIGNVYVTANGLRSRREPGIELSESAEIGLPKGLPIYDENPEVFEMDPNRFGLPNNPIRGGTAFLAIGILAQYFGDYEFRPQQLSLTNREYLPIPETQNLEISIASQNLYLLFDDVDDPLITILLENNTTTKQFNTRLTRLSHYFRLMMHSPEIIIVQEVENLNALQSLADKMNADDPQLNYSAYHFANEISSGINLGVLTRQTVTDVTVTQLGAVEILQFGDTQEKLHIRVPQLINATVSKAGLNQEFNLLSIHLKSRGNITGGNAEKTRNRRYEQSLSVAQMVQNTQTNLPTIPLMVIGAFNAYEFTDGYVDVVGEIKGQINPTNNLLSSNGSTVVNPVLTNASDTLPDDEKYSVANFNSTELMDHVLLNDIALMQLNSIQYLRGNADEAVINRIQYTGEYGLSDRDGFVIYYDLLAPGDLLFRNSFE